MLKLNFLTFSVEELSWVFACQCYMPRNGSKEFYNMCQMIFIPGILFTTRMRLKQVITCRQLKCLKNNQWLTFRIWIIVICIVQSKVVCAVLFHLTNFGLKLGPIHKARKYTFSQVFHKNSQLKIFLGKKSISSEWI